MAGGAAACACAVSLQQPDLECSLAHVAKKLRRAKQQIEERAGERRNERERDGRRDVQSMREPPPCIHEDPEG